jgi:hypothetical protein
MNKMTPDSYSFVLETLRLDLTARVNPAAQWGACYQE